MEFTPEQIAAYNAARKAQRHDATRRDLDAIYDVACNLELTSAVPVGANAEAHADRARQLFAYLITLCNERGVLQCAPTNEHLCADLDIGRRNIVFAFRELEAGGLGKRSGGKGGLNQPNEAATWTFYRSPNLACKPQQEAICTLSILELDLDHESLELVSARENEHAIDLDCWAWSEVEHSADELNVLDDLPAEAAPAQQEAPQAPVVLDQAEAASYTPVPPAPSHKPYSGITKHTQDTEARYALVWEAMRLVERADDSDQAEQLPLDQPSMPKPRRASGKPSAIDRYLVELAGMSESELAGEVRKHNATLKKHSGAPWLKGIRDRLLLVERELDARELHSTAPDTRPLTSSHTRKPVRATSQQVAF